MLTFQEFISRVNSKTISCHTGIFAFIGPEKFLRDKGLNLIRSVASDLTDVKSFSLATFDSRLFLSELYSVPFFQQRKLVVLNLGDITPETNKLSDLDTALEEYALSPSLFSLLAITAEKWELRPALKNLILKNNGLIIECAGILDHQLIRWIMSEVQSYGKILPLPAARFLVEQVGNDLAKIDETIQKLVLFAGKEHQIGRESLQKLVAEDREYDKRILVKAILSHQASKALEILTRLIAEGDETYQIIGYLAGTFKREALPLKIRRQKIETLLETDLAIKTGLIPEDRALQLLVVKLSGRTQEF